MSRRSFKSTFSTLVFLFIASLGIGQTIDLGDFAVKAAYAQFKAKQVIPPSPDAANLGKFGNVPVSLFTGSPQISIPLVSLGTRFPLNVSLSYNNTGFKPGEPASWVGLGWNLNAGGIVTRSAMGNPDLNENYYNQVPLTLPPNNDLFARYDIINSIRSGATEVQPDVFYYNAGKLSGKFYIRQQDQAIIKKTRDESVITHCITCLPGQSWFQIVDDQGFRYEFRAVETSYTVTDTQTPSDVMPVRTAYTYASSWYLSKITSPDSAEIIEFDYYSAAQPHTTLNNNIQGQSITFQRAADGSSGITSSTSFSDLSMNKIYEKKYLKTITVKRDGISIAYAEFLSSVDSRQDLDDLDFPGERLLNKVQLFQRDGFGSTFKLKQEFELSYGYFSDPAFNTVAGKRLRLESVRENAVDGSTASKPPYQFVYKPFINNVTNPTGLDHWGFANGALNTTMIPPIQIDGQIYTYGSGGNREPSSALAECGLIQSITYPTGGSTVFQWEAHSGYDQNNVLMTPGGLRIRAITDYSGSGSKASARRYSYIRSDGLTSGRAAAPVYISTSSFTYYPENTLGTNNNETVNYNRWTVSASPSLGLGTVQGSHIGYARVVEEQIDTLGQNPLGTTIYEYQLSNLDPYNDDIGNGDLVKSTIKDNSGKVLLETTNQYSYNIIGSITYRSPATETIQDSKPNLCKYTYNGTVYYEWRNLTTSAQIPCDQTRFIKTRFNFGGYTVNVQEKFLVQQTQRLYDKLSNNYVNSVKNFSYGNPVHTLPTKIEQLLSNNTVVVNEIKYPKDYNASVAVDLPASGIKDLQNKNIMGAEIENLQYQQNTDGSNKQLINGQISMYEAGINPTKLYRLENATPISPITSSYISGSGSFIYDQSNFKLYATLLYDNAGNLIKQEKTSDIITAYIWDHSRTIPTAEAKNAAPEMIAYTSFESDGPGGFNSLPNLTTSRTMGGFSGGYGYNLSGNTITKTDLPAGRTYVISYWSANGPVTVTGLSGIIAPKQDIYPSHLGWTYYEHLADNPGSIFISGNSTIDELRIYPSDAAMSTVAYLSYDARPNTTVDASNARSAFEYDGLNRLINIRDDDNNIVKNFSYQYGLLNTVTLPSKTLYYSSPAQGTFSRQGCPAPTQPVPIVYMVAYGRYGAVTQSAADALANSDVQQNGQSYANANGKCVYYNSLQSGLFYKNNCSYEQGPSTCPLGVTYTVPQGTYYGNTQAEADQLALNDVNANGQNYANTNCSCSCDGINKKFINGICETGTIVYTGYQYVPNCQTGWNYRCFYYYQFSDGTTTATYSSCSRVACVPQ